MFSIWYNGYRCKLTFNETVINWYNLDDNFREQINGILEVYINCEKLIVNVNKMTISNFNPLEKMQNGGSFFNIFL